MHKPDIRDYQRLAETREVVVSQKQLPLHCPLDQNALWCAHPRVFLPIEAKEGATTTCPYCGTLYRLLD